MHRSKACAEKPLQIGSREEIRTTPSKDSPRVFVVAVEGNCIPGCEFNASPQLTDGDIASRSATRNAESKMLFVETMISEWRALYGEWCSAEFELRQARDRQRPGLAALTVRAAQLKEHCRSALDAIDAALAPAHTVEQPLGEVCFDLLSGEDTRLASRPEQDN